jgi:hypothetical protein
MGHSMTKDAAIQAVKEEKITSFSFFLIAFFLVFILGRPLRGGRRALLAESWMVE